MKKTPLYALLCALPGLAAAQAGPAAGRIDQVLVYPGGATVERSAPVKAGQQQLKIGCLPARFDTDSLQLRAPEGSGVSIGDITVQTLERAAAPECASSPLDARIREFEEQRAALSAEAAAHELALGYLKNYTAPNAQIGATAETLRRSGLETLQRQHALQRRKDDLERQLAPLLAERERLVQANPQVRMVTVRLAAPRDAELRLSYRLSQAGWEPVYRAYLDSGTGQVRLERHAQVAQNSGEDWSEVKLRLSTAQPRQATGMPAPVAWTLDLLPPPSADGPRPVAAFAPPPEMMVEAPGSRRVASPDLGFNVAVFQGEFATEFEVPGRVAVAADGQRIALALGSVQLNTRLMARTQPRSEAQAYLVAESARPAGVWPAGALQLFRDGGFIGQSRLNIGNQDQLDLFFGRDELVRVSVEPEQRNAGNSGFIGARAEQKIGRVYKIENLHQRAFAVQVLETAPVARHEDIRVQAQFDPKPSQEAWRKQPGVMAWDFSLPAGASQRIGADYLISYPKDARISGMR